MTQKLGIAKNHETYPNYQGKHTYQIIRGHIENSWQNVNFMIWNLITGVSCYNTWIVYVNGAGVGRVMHGEHRPYTAVQQNVWWCCTM